MRFTITNEISGRIRAKCDLGHIDEAEARGISYELMRVDGVRHAEVHMANGSLLLRFDPLKRDQVLAAVGAFDVLNLPREEEAGLEDFCSSIEMALENNRFQMEVVTTFARRWIMRSLPLPAVANYAYVILRAIPFVVEGVKRLFKKELTVEVLDATAITLQF